MQQIVIYFLQIIHLILLIKILDNFIKFININVNKILKFLIYILSFRKSPY